jgi:phage terminase small subunit
METTNSGGTGRPPGSGATRKKIEAKVHRWLVYRLKKDFPHLRDARYMTELAVYCSTYILHQRAVKRVLQSESDADPLLNEAGELRSSLDTIRRLALAVSVLGKNLGISPSSHGKFLGDIKEAEFSAVREALQDDESPARIETEVKSNDEI